MSLSSLARKAIHRLRTPFARRIGQKIFFAHVPKCGGTSLDRAIRGHHPDPGQTCVGLHSDAAGKGARILARNPHAYNHDLLLYFLSHPEVRYVSGHFRMSELLFREFAKEWHFITLLRHPVSRWFSHYFYRHHGKTPDLRTSDDIVRFADSPQGRLLGRSYVSFFSGEGVVDSGTEEGSLDQALAVLQRFSLVGCLEHLPDFCRGFEQRFGVRLDIGRENASPVAAGERDRLLTDRVKETVRAVCRPNLEVYEAVVAEIRGRQGERAAHANGSPAGRASEQPLADVSR